MNCGFARLALHAYIDAELAPSEALALEAHLLDCRACRREYEAVLATVESVRGAHGVYERSETSRVRAQRLIARAGRSVALRTSFAAAVAIALLLSPAAFVARRAPGDTISEFAADAHIRYTNGRLPLDIRSERPQLVADWLSDHVSFRIVLPDNRPYPGQAEKYVLEGARLLEPGPDEKAYIAYRVGNRLVSLVMTSSSRVVPSGGEVRSSGGLEFHTRLLRGLRVITWADKGVKYALVSEPGVGASESCIVCHGGDRIRPDFGF